MLLDDVHSTQASCSTELINIIFTNIPFFYAINSFFFNFIPKEEGIKTLLFRDTQDTLAVIESLDLDGDPPTQEEVSPNIYEI